MFGGFTDQTEGLVRTPGMSGHVRVARYIRVSRADQNPQLQSDETERLITNRGWDLTATYLDRGISGTKDTRPELMEMMAAARRGEFKVLLVWRSDRLFRSLRHMISTIEDLAALGIDFCSVTEPFDSTTPSGRLLFHLVSAFAEFERVVLVERTRAGLDAARRRGARIGRPRVNVDVERATLLRASGKSLRETARILGVGAATLHRALARAEP
jgi:DNA invertase Pin-like site-specific DNA recombinase